MTTRSFRRSIVNVAAVAALAAGLLVVTPTTAGAGIFFDVSVTKTNNLTSVNAGDHVTYTITVSNAGPNTVAFGFEDDMPDVLTNVSWTCAGANGGFCIIASGSGDIATSPSIASGGSVTYTVEATLSITATGQLVNTATAITPAGDTNVDNDAATDTDVIVAAPPGNESAAAAPLVAAPRSTG